MPNMRPRQTRPTAQNHHRARRVRRMHDGVRCSCPSRIAGRSSPQDLRAELRGEVEESEVKDKLLKDLKAALLMACRLPTSDYSHKAYYHIWRAIEFVEKEKRRAK